MIWIRRKAKSHALQRTLFLQFHGRCFLCTKLFTEDHHILPWSMTKNHDPQFMAPACSFCHEVLTYAPHLISISHQLELRSNALSTFSTLELIETHIVDRQIARARQLFLDKNVLDRLVTMGAYPEAEGVIRSLLRDPKPVGERDFLLLLGFAEIRFWHGDHLLAFRQLNNIESRLSGMSHMAQARYYEIRGRVLNYLADDPLLQDLIEEKVSQSDSVESYDAALELETDPNRKGLIYSSRASSKKSLNEIDCSKDDCIAGLDSCDPELHARGRESNLDRLASLYLQEKRYDDSLFLLRESLTLAFRSGHRRGIAYRLRHLARSFHGLGELRDAILAAKLGYAFSQSFSDPNFIWIQTAIQEMKSSVERAQYERFDQEVSINRRSLLKTFLN